MGYWDKFLDCYVDHFVCGLYLIFTLVFQLPLELDELEFVEEKSSVDENIMSSLSLGPSSLETARNSGINNGINMHI